MEKRNICNNKFSYNLKNKVVGLPVAFKGFPGEIKVEKNDLMLRESFHVSLVCVGKIIEKYNISISLFLLFFSSKYLWSSLHLYSFFLCSVIELRIIFKILLSV